MKFLFFSSQSSYGTIEIYIRNLRRAITRAGHRTLIVKLNEKSSPGQFIRRFNRFKPDATLGINVNYFFLPGKRDFYDLTGVPHFSFFLDHPFYHLHNFHNPASENFYFSCPDRSHVEYVNELWPMANVCFLPHAAARSEIVPNGRKIRNRGAFFGSPIAPPNSLLNKHRSRVPEIVLEIAVEAAIRLLKNPERPLHRMIRRLLKQKNQAGLYQLQKFRIDLLYLTEQYFRARARLNFFNRIRSLPVDIYGKENREIEARFANSKLNFFPPLSHSEMLARISEYNWTLNESCFFPRGSHKRVVDSLARGVPVVSTPSSHLEKQFSTGIAVELSDLDRESSIAAAIKAIETRNLSAEPSKITEELISAHATWSDRAEKIIRTLNSHGK